MQPAAAFLITTLCYKVNTILRQRLKLLKLTEYLVVVMQSVVVLVPYCNVCVQDALIDMVRRSRVHFVHCLLPKAEAVGGGGEPRVTHGESADSGLMTLDVGLLRAQLRGSKLLDALRIYRQGNEVDLLSIPA